MLFSNFSYRLEEQLPVLLTSPTQAVTIQVRCLNDGPELTVPGQGTQALAAFTTVLSGAGLYTLPAPVVLLDVDGVAADTGPAPGTQRITITTVAGMIAVDQASFPAIAFTTTATSIVFETELATANAILATLMYTAPALGPADTLTILANDGGSNQRCANGDVGPCPLLAGINVDIAFDAGTGAPPGSMPLTPGSGGFVVVDTTNDAVASDASCTLREAVQATNTDAAVDGCAAGVGADIIVLPTGTYLLGLGTINVAEALTIVGAGAAFSIVDGGATAAFTGTPTLSDVTVLP